MENEATRPFQILVAQLEGGAFHEDAGEELRKLTLRLREHSESYGKAKGKLIITLDLEVDRDRGGVLTISPTMEAKAPRARRKATTMWVTEGGNLSVTDPKQQTLPFGPRALPAEPPIRDIAAPTQQPKEAK